MGKTPKLKNKATSIHSRAARRASSPTIAVKDTGPAPKPNAYIPHTQYAGVRKRKAPRTRSQKLRQQKVVQRADAVAAQRAAKLVKSEDRGKVVRERRKDWDNINAGRKKKTLPGFEALQLLDPDDVDGAMDDIDTRNKGSSITELPIRMTGTEDLQPTSDDGRETKERDEIDADDDI